MLLGIFLSFAVQAASPAIQTVVTDSLSQVEDPKQAIARTPAECEALWRQHAGPAPVPKVDFASRTVVAVFLGTRSSAGYGVEITGTRTEKETLVVEWRERRPKPGDLTAQVITSHAHIATIPKFAGEIRFAKVSPGAGRRARASPRGCRRSCATPAGGGPGWCSCAQSAAMQPYASTPRSR